MWSAWRNACCTTFGADRGPFGPRTTALSMHSGGASGRAHSAKHDRAQRGLGERRDNAAGTQSERRPPPASATRQPCLAASGKPLSCRVPSSHPPEQSASRPDPGIRIISRTGRRSPSERRTCVAVRRSSQAGALAQQPAEVLARSPSVRGGVRLMVNRQIERRRRGLLPKGARPVVPPPRGAAPPDNPSCPSREAAALRRR